MPSKLTILALIGIGKWGKNYLNSCTDLPDVKIGYVCAKSIKTLESLSDKYYKTTKIEDLLIKKDVSGFIIASPTSTHFKIAQLLIKNNKNILIEKPVTNSFNKTKLLYSLSKKHPRVIVMAGHVQLYDENYQKLLQKIKNIGEIRKLEYVGLQSPERPDVGVYWDWCPHPLYLFSDITNKQPKIVSVKTIKPDNLTISLSYSEKISGKINVGWTYPTKKRSFTVIGKKGKLSLKQIRHKYTPLQNEILTYVNCINKKIQPPSNLKQALDVAEAISKIEKYIK